MNLPLTFQSSTKARLAHLNDPTAALLVMVEYLRVLSPKLCKPLREQLFIPIWTCGVVATQVSLKCHFSWTLERDDKTNITKLWWLSCQREF